MAKLSDAGLAQDGSDGVKHAHFDQAEPSVQHGAYDDHDHLSSASDEDARPVEVSFDPTNPYRRKSSLVSEESIMPQLSKQSKKTQCLVHQILESHRKAQHRDVRPEANGNLTTVIDPKGKDERRASKIEPDSAESTDAGQLDEQSWKTSIDRSKSELDLNSEDHGELHSRLLTKKQLSEMAWGVRELSRRLGSVRLRFKAKTIFILTKVFDAELIPKTREITKWLLSHHRDVRYTVYIEDTLKEHKKFDAPGLIEELRREYIEAGDMESDTPTDVLGKRLRYWNEKMCRTRPHTFDFVISLGGDGTVLYASWLFQRIVPPVLSFALGSLGFLTKFDFSDYENILSTAFKDGVTVSLRLRFEGTIMRSQKRQRPLVNGPEDEDEAQSRRDLVEELIGEEKDDEHTHRPDGTFEILNEIVVDRGPNPTLSYTEIFGDDEHFTSVMADGLCVSTPTGSTAYNLAAGGSLCHPDNPVMLLTSICAHTLSFRPIILPDTMVLRIGVPYNARTSSWASFDGRERVEMRPGDYVTISASRFPFASVMPQGRRSEDWINSISGKLGWNTRQKQKNEGYKPWN
ncbi:ATP-NAD kinase-like domain-containing protein [Pestalotiopsis sp. NC0098]|nr:ATP-NAD kinase-like domain-containing protein [Pestalotiopsis sp. NC0098]